jgi:hypothetical protein
MLMVGIDAVCNWLLLPPQKKARQCLYLNWSIFLLTLVEWQQRTLLLG